MNPVQYQNCMKLKIKCKKFKCDDSLYFDNYNGFVIYKNNRYFWILLFAKKTVLVEDNAFLNNSKRCENICDRNWYT